MFVFVQISISEAFSGKKEKQDLAGEENVI
jgi:hypothetical protein